VIIGLGPFNKDDSEDGLHVRGILPINAGKRRMIEKKAITP
jgi:hypothetical protein